MVDNKPLNTSSDINASPYPFKVQWLFYVPPGLTLINSTFCPHSVFMCFRTEFRTNREYSLVQQ